MLNKWKFLSIEDKFFLIYFFFNFIVLCFLIFLNYDDINILIERAKSVFSFWILLFLIIFLPRRMLKKSRRFRYFVLYLRKKYPIFFYYQDQRFNILSWIYFFFLYSSFYLERVLKYVLVGTKVKLLRPYKEDWKKKEFIKEVIIEIYQQTCYLIIYVFKIFYEIIKYFDGANIYVIIRSRILAYMLVTIGYIVIGNKFLAVYFSCLIIGFYLFVNINLYLNYKKKKNFKYDIDILLKIKSDIGAEKMAIELYFFIIPDIRHVTKIFLTYFKKDFYWKALKRKYGSNEVLKLRLNIINLTRVVVNQNITNKNEVYLISKYKFVTDFYLKKLWYNKNIMNDKIIYDSFCNSIYALSQVENLLEFYLIFIQDVVFLLVDEEDVISEHNFNMFFNKETKEGLYYFFYLKNYFEFSEIYRLINDFENKKNIFLFSGLKQKLKEIEFFKILNICNYLVQYDLLTPLELDIILNKMYIEFLLVLDIKLNENEHKKYLERVCKKEDLFYVLFKEVNKINLDDIKNILYEIDYIAIFEKLYFMKQNNIINDVEINHILFHMKLLFFNKLNKIEVDESLIKDLKTKYNLLNKK